MIFVIVWILSYKTGYFGSVVIIKKIKRDVSLETSVPLSWRPARESVNCIDSASILERPVLSINLRVFSDVSHEGIAVATDKL